MKRIEFAEKGDLRLKRTVRKAMEVINAKRMYEQACGGERI